MSDMCIIQKSYTKIVVFSLVGAFAVCTAKFKDEAKYLNHKKIV